MGGCYLSFLIYFQITMDPFDFGRFFRGFLGFGRGGGAGGVGLGDEQADRHFDRYLTYLLP